MISGLLCALLQVYTIYSILCIVFIILVIVTAFITIALTYFQLAVEDHRWWWRSFLCGGSTGALPNCQEKNTAEEKTEHDSRNPALDLLVFLACLLLCP